MEAKTFRKKPVVIEARKLEASDDPHEIARWCSGRVVPDPQKVYTGGPLVIEIDTLEGTMRASLGDWIIREPFPTGDRQFYPCKPDIFAETYESVTETV